MGYVETRTRTFIASAALAEHRRVHLNEAGKLAYCGASDTDCIGVLARPTFAADEPAAVALNSAQGTVQMVCSAAGITKGGAVYAAANGKIASTGTILVGIALATGAGDLSIIEVIPSPAPGTIGTLARSGLNEDALSPFPVGLDAFRVWDAPGTLPVTSAGNDDLALTYNTFLTAAPTFETADAKAATKTQKIGFQIKVPECYVAAGDAKIRVAANMKTTVSDTTATIDVQAARILAPTVDLVATAAQSINSLDAAYKDFVLTVTDLVPGDVLDVVVTIAITDSATATAVIGQLRSVTGLFDIKG